MKVGLIGAGNMAGALARGLARGGEGPELLIADVAGDKARALADEIGGTAVESNAAVRDAADLVVLCHKPAQLDEVAAELEGRAPTLASILWGVKTAELELAYPSAAVYRFMPNVAAEVGEGVLCYAPGKTAADGPEDEVLELFGRAGEVVPLPEDMIDTAGALSACGPAFFALAAEALAEAAARRGLSPRDAARLSAQTLAGAGRLLQLSDGDTAALRARVATPGGVTAKGLDALEADDLRGAFDRAVAAVVDPS